MWSTPDPELQEQVRERQRVTIGNYTHDPDLLEEHVGMEDNFQAGGYGERQIEELLQNAIDRLAEPGRVEFRLAHGTLYCANEGEPFAAAGVRAITGAFLSPKRDEQIGRFGLGFKSVLGVTEHPQILSRTVSFGFNEPEAAELLADLPYRPTRVPTLRVPSVIDAMTVAAVDPNVAEMMEWATTIVRLPLVRGGARLRERLKDFDFRYLLFPDRLNQVVISLGDREKVVSRSYRKTVDVDAGLVTLKSPDAGDAVWRVLHREHDVSERVKSNLPGLFQRDHVRVSYALPVGQVRREDGEFWAWFPLLDKTTAQGIFNAPWQVNDDRTSLHPSSALNGEMLEVAAELLIDAAMLESTTADPAKHFDVLPARGREARSAADAYMSGRVPQLARRHQLIPTASGEMRSPARVRAPFVANGSGDRSFALPSEAVRLWSEATRATDTPHWSCYKTQTRAARLTQLLSDENEKISATSIAPAAWLAEVAAQRTREAVDAALTIFLKLKEQQEQVWRQFTGAPLVPLEDGTMARISDFDKILLPVEAMPNPNNVQLVASSIAAAPEVRGKLLRLGVHEVSRDQVAIAAATAAKSAWGDGDWKQLWEMLAQASPDAGRAAIATIQQRGIKIQVPTRAGTWTPASHAFRDASQVPGLPERQVDIPGVMGRSDLVGYAGCLSGVVENWPVHEGEVFEEYRAAMQARLEVELAPKYGQNVRACLRFEARKGSGPLEILKELAQVKTSEADLARARLTVAISEAMPQQQISVLVDIRGAQRSMKAGFDSVEKWCVRKYGLLDSTWGARKPNEVVAKALIEYSDLLPVVRESLAGHFTLPNRLDVVPTTILRELLERDEYTLANAVLLGEVLGAAAARSELAGVTAIPALEIRGRLVHVTPIDQVVLAATDELDDLASHGFRYIPSGPWDEALSKAWNLQTAADVIARSIDWDAIGDAVPVLDVYPTLDRALPTETGIDDAMLRRCNSIVRRTTSPTGSREQRLSGHVDGRTVLVDADLSDIDALVEVSRLLRLGLTRNDAEGVVAADERLRKNALVQRVQAAPTESAKLLTIVGRAGLVANLPDGLLDIIEGKQGKQSDAAIADLFLSTHGNDSLRRLKGAIAARGLAVPRAWDGSSEADGFVTSLGFPRAFAGIREKKAPAVDVVPGKVELKPLHEFQEDLLKQIRELVLIREKDGEHRRGLLYLPTGAGKTRVTTESIARMLRDDELAAPVLWIAQSEELCEQAIVTWTEVWRAIGDERPLEITRYWDSYEADESLQELQVVVATDAKLAQMIESSVHRQSHRWLQDAKLVVIDEAHRAGSRRYTEILDWLGIDQRRGAHTARPLLGLTATPYRGTNLEANRLFAQRFGDRRLDALDPKNPIEQLREMRVLSNVDHQLLDSNVRVSESPTISRTGAVAWNDVSRAILDKLGSNLDRTQLLVDHILRQDPEWPILVFTPSVVSAHVTAALLRTLDRTAEAVDGEMRGQERRRKIESFTRGETRVLVNCDLLTQGFDAPKVRALYIARPTFSPNRYVQMVGRGLRGPKNGGTDKCLIVNVVDTFEQFDKDLAYTEFDYLWTKKGTRAK